MPGSPDVVGVPAQRLAGLGAPRADGGANRRRCGTGDPRGRPELRVALGRIPRARQGCPHVPRHHRHLRGHPQRGRTAGPRVRGPRTDRGGGLRAVHLSRGASPRWVWTPRRSASTSTAPRSTNSIASDAAAALLTPAHFFPHGVPLHRGAADRGDRLGPPHRPATCWRTTTTASSATTASPSAPCRASIRSESRTSGRPARACPPRCGWAGWRCPTTSSNRVIAAAGGQQFYVNAIDQLTMADFITVRPVRQAHPPDAHQPTDAAATHW